MYEIRFYCDNKGRSPVDDYLTVLELKNDKDSRINANKIRDAIRFLNNYGLENYSPLIKHIRGKIWELRPLDKRILFFKDDETFVLLHIFRKETNKTPIGEIIKAEKEMRDYLERNKDEEQNS